MPKPLICTSNSWGHVDYGTPITARKSTDYRTSTGTYHRHIAGASEEFDCRCKGALKKDHLEKNLELRNRNSSYNVEHCNKICGNNPLKRYARAEHAKKINYIRNVQENISHDIPHSTVHLSEMKDNYQQKYPECQDALVFPPNPYSFCEVKGLGRDVQPAIRPEENGSWKLLDPYLTTNRLVHVPFTVEQQNGIARKDIVTFYDTTNIKPCKGFGARNGPAITPLVTSKKTPVYDRILFKVPAVDKTIHQPPKRVPYMGMKSESRDNYINQTYSNIFPYLFEIGVEFPDSLPGPSKWQTLAPPGMYCTENWHIGTGWPIAAVVDPGLSKEHVPHKPCCVRVK